MAVNRADHPAEEGQTCHLNQISYWLAQNWWNIGRVLPSTTTCSKCEMSFISHSKQATYLTMDVLMATKRPIYQDLGWLKLDTVHKQNVLFKFTAA